VQLAGHVVDLALQQRRDVDGVARRARGGQRGLGLGQVAQRVVHAGLHQVRLHQHLLVVQLLQLAQQPVDQRLRLAVRALHVQQVRQLALHALPEEGAPLGPAPGHHRLAEGRLQLQGVGHLGDRVNDRAHDLCSPSLWYPGEVVVK